MISQLSNIPKVKKYTFLKNIQEFRRIGLFSIYLERLCLNLFKGTYFEELRYVIRNVLDFRDQICI